MSRAAYPDLFKPSWGLSFGTIDYNETVCQGVSSATILRPTAKGTPAKQRPAIQEWQACRIDADATILPNLDHYAPARWRTGSRRHCLGSSNHRPREASPRYVRAHGLGAKGEPPRRQKSAISHGASLSMMLHAAPRHSPTRSEASCRQTAAAAGPYRRPLTVKSEYRAYYGRP